MSEKRAIAPRFFHGVPKRVGPEMGFRLDSVGRLAVVHDDDAVRESLLLLLATLPGERVMRPDYGCSLQVLVFSPNDLTTAGLAIHYVRRAIQRLEPRVEILHLDANPDVDSPNHLVIELEYAVRTTRRTGQLRFSVSLTGERT